jgi:hypothetical protein
MVWLATLHVTHSIDGKFGEFVWPVHPVDTSVDVVFIAYANLQNAGHPFLFFIGKTFLVVDAVLV